MTKFLIFRHVFLQSGRGAIRQDRIGYRYQVAIAETGPCHKEKGEMAPQRFKMVKNHQLFSMDRVRTGSVHAHLSREKENFSG